MANQGYVGTDYDKWAKLYGIGMGQDGKYIAPEKTNEMSDTDYQIGQTLYRAYLENQRLDSEYGKGKQTLADNKREAEIAADVTLQRMQKYLPQQLVKQGLYGTGASEDAYLKLQNQYQKSVSDAAKSYNDGLSALESVYQQNKNSVWEQANTGVNTVLENEAFKSRADYDSAIQELKLATSVEEIDNILAQHQNMDPELYNNLENYTKNLKNNIAYDTALEDLEMAASVKEIDDILAQYQNKDSKLYEKLEKRAKTLKDDIEEVTKNTPHYRAKLTHYDDLDEGDAIRIEITNGAEKKDIYLKSGGAVSETNDVISYAKENIHDGTAFAYYGEIYLKQEGVVYKLRSRGSSDENRKLYNTLKHYLNYGLGNDGKIYNATV
ncbi:MAG: hypothetical protein IKB51_03925 [Clostridia bacterium]|nr:hypothetical protein [Clostridia bacterium]